MIVEFFCNIIFSVANFFIGVLPTFPKFESLNAPLQSILYTFRFIDIFVDVKVLSVGLIIVLVIYNIKFGWSIVMWLVRKIPGVS